MQTGFAFSRFADRLASIVELSPGDLELLANMPSSICHYDSCHHVLKKGDHPNHCCLLLQGYLCWQDVDNHYGQITSIHVPGDVPDLYTVHDPRIDFDLVTLRPAVVASVPHRFFREISALSPSISRALLFLLLTDAAASRNCIVNLGSRDALARVAHLLCEVTARLRAVGLARVVAWRRTVSIHLKMPSVLDRRKRGPVAIARGEETAPAPKSGPPVR